MAERLYFQIVDDLARAGMALGDGVMQLPARPEVPWLAVVLTGASAVIPTNVMDWAGDFERCMAWAILEGEKGGK